MLYRLIERIRYSSNIKKIILATTTNSEDNLLEKFCKANDIICYRGSSEDVLLRLKEAAINNNVQHIIEILGDNPIVHSDIIDACINKYISMQANYLATATTEYPHLKKDNLKLFPIGIRVQIFSLNVLLDCDEKAKEKNI